VSVSGKSAPVILLRWTLALVVLWESFRFAVSPGAARHLEGMGLPSWLAPALGGVEIAAALLFLVPSLRRIGGWSLLVIFAFAAALHLLHGEFQIGPLIVYSAAVLVCMAASPSAGNQAPS